MVNNNLVELANQFHLVGRRCVMVELQLAGIDGQVSLSYHDEYVAREFHGDDVVHDHSQLGDLYTVVLRTVDGVGDLTFTVVIPPLNIAGSHHVETIGVRAVRRRPGAISEGGAVLGQAESYRTCRLWGTATQVQTLASAHSA